MINQKLVKQWFIYAARDLKLAKQSLDFSKDFRNASAFLAQQAAEKAVKGFLAFHRVRFQKTHNLKALAEDVATVDVKLAKLLRRHKGMTKYAVAYRYPSESQRALTTATTRKVIENANAIYNECYTRVYGAK